MRYATGDSTLYRVVFSVVLGFGTLLNSTVLVAFADEIPSSPVPITPQAVPTLSPAELTAYWARPLAELCNSSSQSVRDFEAIQLLGLVEKCKTQRSVQGFWGNAAYGYQHPTPTACNAGTGVKTGAAAFSTGRSVGTANFLSIFGTLLTVLFAGCNNAPPQTQAQTVAQAAGAAAQQTGGTSPLVLSVQTLTLVAGQTSDEINVSEPNYSGTFTLTADSKIARPDAATGSVTTGSPLTFHVIAGPTAGSTTITIVDASNNKATLSVTVTASPPPSVVPAPKST